MNLKRLINWNLINVALKGSDLRNFKVFLEAYAQKIVEKWIDFFVYHKDINFERITKKIK